MLMSVQSSNEEARQLLEKELEKFLARGGKITELERGYTAFPDGNIPKVGQIHASMTAEEREARNAEARQARELEAERKRAERAKYQEEQRKKREAEKKAKRAREAQEAAWFKRELELAAQEEAKEIARKQAAQQRIAEIQAEHDARARRLEEKRKETEKKLAVKQAKHESLMIKMQQEQFERMERLKQQELQKEQQQLEKEELVREQKLQAEKRKKLLAMTAAQRKQAEKIERALKRQQKRDEINRELNERRKLERRMEKAARERVFKLVTFEYRGDDYWRRAAQRMLKADAIQRGDSEFMGLCVNHNRTLFRISPSGLTRCVECKRIQNKVRPKAQKEESENTLRLRKNLERRRQAILEGKKEFTATCKRHGETVYRFRVDRGAYCVQCELDRQAAKREVTKNGRHVRIREARTAAIQKGERYFEFECTKHGMTTYRISKVASVCMQCKRDRDLARLRKIPEDQLSPESKRRRENRRRFEQAIANQQTHFIGVCNIHGEGRYSTYPGTINYGAGYRCVACKTEKTGRVVRKNLCNNLKDPDVVKFKKWVESRGRGELYRIARYLGLSRSSISHINNGRARITPENLEKLNQYYKENGGTDE